jgi:hypothetical protein
MVSHQTSITIMSMLALCQPTGHLRGNAGHWLYLHQPAGHIKPFFGQFRSDITKPAVNLRQMPRRRKTWLLSPS